MRDWRRGWRLHHQLHLVAVAGAMVIAVVVHLQPVQVVRRQIHVTDIVAVMVVVVVAVVGVTCVCATKVIRVVGVVVGVMVVVVCYVLARQMTEFADHLDDRLVARWAQKTSILPRNANVNPFCSGFVTLVTKRTKDGEFPLGYL